MALGSGGFPFFNSPGLSRPAIMTASGAYGHILTGNDGITTEAGTVTLCSGAAIAAGILTTPQGDPNNGGAFVSGNVVDVTFTGVAPVLLVDAAYSKGDQIVPSTTIPGFGTKVGATHSGQVMSLIGTYADLPKTIASGSTTQYASVELSLTPQFLGPRT